MFDIAWSELLLIAIVALIFIGPKELPALLNSLGRTAAKLRRSADDFRRHFEDSMREAGYEDLHKNIDDLRSLNPSNQLRATIDNAINRSYAPKPPPAGTQPSTPPSFAATATQTAGQAEQTGLENGATSAAAASEASSSPISAASPDIAAQAAQKAAIEPAKDHATPVA